MKKILTLAIGLILGAQVAFAQQDPMFTKYMFNSLAFNPAYAGAQEHLSLGLLHRTQWWGLNGGPQTQTITAHTPLKNNRVGVGMALMNDNIGPTNTFTANASYAYRIPIGTKAKLSIGLQAGFQNYIYDPNKVNPFDPTDPVLGAPINKLRPNFGAGLYYSTKKFYVGFSAPHLIEFAYSGTAKTPGKPYAAQYRHYFTTMGAAIPINGDALIFKPSIMIRNVGLLSNLNKDVFKKKIAAPTGYDVDLSLLFYQTFWLGAAYRSAFEQFAKDSNGKNLSSVSSVNVWMSYNLPNGLRVGAAYDYSLTKLQKPTQGSFEVFLGYEFDYKEKKVVTPRYF